jgi:hypothetical protein
MLVVSYCSFPVPLPPSLSSSCFIVAVAIFLPPTASTTTYHPVPPAVRAFVTEQSGHNHDLHLASDKKRE